MALNRERIFTALFARLASVTDWKFSSRINMGQAEAFAVQQPALFLLKGNEAQVQEERNVGLPMLWKLTALVTILCRNEDPNAAPSIQLNQLIQAVEAALELQPGEKRVAGAVGPAVRPGQQYTTLGGLVSLCTISGDIIVFEGMADGTVSSQAGAHIPIELLASS